MQIKKNLLVTFAILMLGLTSVVAIAPAYAATATNNTVHQNFFDGLIAFLAQKFGLDQNQVKSAVADYQIQHKQQMQQNMQNREQTRLDSLVKQGKITKDQETAIMNELQTLKIDPASLQGKTSQERMQLLEQQRDALIAWAKANNIDPNLIMPFGGMRRMGRMGGKGWYKGWVNPSATPTQTN